jgi:hypothetical protein
VEGIRNDESYFEPSSRFCELTEKLSEASVRRYWRAYHDIEWDRPEHVVDKEDPRWQAKERWDPLAQSAWYQDQSTLSRSVLGLRRQAQLLKVGTEFESVLSQGLLRFAARLPSGHPGFRYLYHEIAEESQHSMMNQEFINRSGCDLDPLSEQAELLFSRLIGLSTSNPILFFLAVLCGEEMFDFLQRQLLASQSIHPLIQRISRIHVIEEARHVSYARNLLLDVVPRLRDDEARVLRYQTPLILEQVGSYLFDFSKVLVPTNGVPEDVRRTIDANSLTSKLRKNAMARMVAFCAQLSLMDRRAEPVWATLRGEL